VLEVRRMTPEWSAPRPCHLFDCWFPALPCQAAEARAWTVAHLPPKVPRRVISAVRLAASEAATNAILHSAGPDFRMHLAVGAHWLYAQCEDHGGATRPHIVESCDPFATGGRGMCLITAVTDLSGALTDGVCGVFFFLSWRPPGAPVTHTEHYALAR
jgi:anti-sigma regulatory factor (Ser/Thr protein kinase)